MKKILIVLIALCTHQLFAQVADDALILSRWNYEGTARFTAMGGAFTALGSDLSSVNLNPAGLGLYRSNDFNFSLEGNLNRTEGNYLDNTSASHHYRTIMPSFGIALSAPNLNNIEENEGPKSWTFALGYNQVHVFNRNFSMEGTNTSNSYLDPELDRINNNAAYNSIFFNADAIYQENGSYTHDYIQEGYGALQKNYVSEKGGIGEYYMAGAANFNDNFYFGGSIGIQSVYLSRSFEFSETTTNDITLNYFDYRESLVTKGIGINAKIGIVYSPVYWSKIGVAFHTPTNYSLTDDYKEEIDVSVNYQEGTEVNSWSETPFFPNYEILTPMRVNAGASFMILRRALLSVDYEYVDYSMAQISSEEASFTTTNNNIDNYYKATHSFRVGAEYKLSMVSLRGGGFYYNSPYASDRLNKDNHQMGYSLGVGIQSGSYYFDLAYSQMLEDFKYAPYTSATGTIDNKMTRITGTMGFRF